ncbi:Protein patched-like 1 [Holothuria leucospilota]|uniref:Protein patched-like 1 n=1 Tax=Holothuria leucospilota TaxID=206669 RepID=A0A9Q1C861_HOLLE|nr:Protein patched-like 1 [Holothuria leucospilota]
MERWAVPATPDSEDLRFASPAPPEECIYEELLTRTSWCNAEYAYRQIERGRAEGNKAALWLRSKIQSLLFTLGCYLQLHSGKAIFLGIVLLGAFTVGLKLAHIETRVDKLWVEVGGRLQKELDYTEKTLGEGAGATNQIILQIAKQEEANLLTKEALLQHLESAKLATQVEVEMSGITWKFRDLCYITDYQDYFEQHNLDDIIDDLMPCTIVTPLDCFWEGAKLLGPENGIRIPNYNETLRWTNLDPQGLVDYFQPYAEYHVPLENVLKSTGIGHGYKDRPCLNPQDPECPSTAPNKHSGEVPDIGYQLTGGCEGFAKKLMKWPEELIIGGTTKNSSGYIESAEALQSIIQLKGEQDMYHAWENHQKVSNIRWDRQKAAQILQEWQRKFTEVVRNSTSGNSTQDVNAFTSTALNDLLEDFSDTSVLRVALGYSIMVVYAFLTMLKLHDGVKSQGGVGLCGVILVSGSVAASLGFCAWIGIMFNAATTQVLPFLALGVGVDDMFLLAHSSTTIPSEIPFVYYTGELLRRAGVSVLLSSCINICGFLSAAVIPIPALRALAFQLAIILAFNLLVMLFVFPAVLALDAERREKRRVDILCCIRRHSPTRVVRVQPRPHCGGSLPYSYRERQGDHNAPVRTEVALQSSVQTVTSAPTHPGGQCVTLVHPGSAAFRDNMTQVYDTPPSTSASNRTLIRQNSVSERKRNLESVVSKLRFWRWSLSAFAKDYYGPFLCKRWVQIPIIVFFSCLLAASVYGGMQMEDGLEIDDVVPQNSREAAFLGSQKKYFSYYNMYIVSQEGMDYPFKQQQLYNLHREVGQLQKVVRNPDGTEGAFWLEVFRDWLLDMQAVFDKENLEYRFRENSWNPNATEKGILAYKMLIQTGRPESQVDIQRYYHGRLVNDQGIIYPHAFYKYLTVWYNYDTISVAATQANLHPTPPEWSPGGKTDKTVEIPTAPNLNYTQLPFFVIDLKETKDFIQLLHVVRNISDYFTSQGLPNYPMGVPFTFWEQYLNLRHYLMMSLACVLGGTFVIITLMLINPWAAIILVFVLGMLLVQLFGFMGLIGLKLSAIPVATLIISVGVGVEFTVHVCFAFLTAVGDRNNRIAIALEHTMGPVLDGGLSTLLGVLMLAGADFMFITYYFFYVFTALIGLGLLNGLVLLPVLLVLFGPPGEVVSPDNGNRLRTPTPPPTPPLGRNVRMNQMGRGVPHHARDSVNNNSHSSLHEQPFGSDHIEVHPPELVVETTRCNMSSVNEDSDVLRPPPPPTQRHKQPHRTHYPTRQHNSFSHPHIPHQANMSASSSSTSPNDSPQLGRHVTTVTATARVSIIHGIPYTTVEYPRHHRSWSKHREGKEAKDLPQIQDKGGGGDSSDTAV